MQYENKQYCGAFLNYSIPKDENRGLVINIHDPYEIMNKNALKFHLTESRILTFLIFPKIIKIDDSMKDYEPDEY